MAELTFRIDEKLAREFCEMAKSWSASDTATPMYKAILAQLPPPPPVVGRTYKIHSLSRGPIIVEVVYVGEGWVVYSMRPKPPEMATLDGWKDYRPFEVPNGM